MNSAHIAHDHSERRKPRYFYHTPFSYIAFWLALMMIVPMSGRISFMPDARADGPNGICEIICPPPDGSIQVCNSDPNDPDCNLTINTSCLCNDGSTFTITGHPSAETCNTDATCNGHGGWAASGGVCLCNDGYSFDIPSTPSFAACSPNPPTFPSCFDHGGWAGGPIAVGGCAELEIFTRCSADAFVRDPVTGATLVNEQLFAGEALGHLETQAIDEVIALHGLSTSTAERDRVLTWARDRVRAQLLAKLVDIINKPAAERTAEEQTLYDWLTIIVWQKRIEPAQKAWEQFQGWQNAVEYATCSWQPPNAVYWQPKWRTATNDPQLISCQADVNLGGQTVQRLCQMNGCSPGLDGIPRTDPTPNQGEIDDILAGLDDGEMCFASGSFVYDQCTLARCAGLPTLPGCTVAIPAHPTYEQFKGYGATLARKNFVYDSSFLSIIGNTSKAASFGIALGTAALVAGSVTGIAALGGGLTAFGSVIFPIAVGHGVASLGAIAFSLFSLVFIVVLAVLTAIIAGISVDEFAQLPGQLQTDVRTAASTTNTAQGKPNLATLITTEAGKKEIFLVFIDTVGPEIDLSGRIAPAPENSPLWAVRDAFEAPLLNESGLDSNGNARLLQVSSWPDADDNTTAVQVGLFGGWFVQQVGNTRSLSLGLEYLKPNGEKWTAWRTTCQDQTNAACTFGQALFVHTRNGDEPPADLSEEALGEWFANTDPILFYKNATGETRMASFATAPTVTGISSTGTPTEGQQFTFTGTASDPNGATVNFAWDFGDGSTATGSPVQHTFVDNGTFPVKVTPTNSFGLSGTPKTIDPLLVIANVAPTATLPTPTSVNEGSPFSLSLTSPSDPSTADTQAGFQYAFNCGSGFGDFGSSSSVSCPTTDNGNIAVTGKIKDKDDGVNEYSATATVNNVAPTATFTATPQIFQGESSTLAFSEQADPSSVDTAAGFTYTYDCTANGTLTVANSGAATATCKYLVTGDFTVGGTISDKDQGATSYTASVTVISPQQAATNLSALVVALNLDARRTSDLTTKIDNALQKLAEGKKDDAQKQLQDFIKKVDDLVKQKLITAAQGQALKDVATRIIASIAVS
jgi:ribosomal protein S20